MIILILLFLDEIFENCVLFIDNGGLDLFMECKKVSCLLSNWCLEIVLFLIFLKCIFFNILCYVCVFVVRCFIIIRLNVCINIIEIINYVFIG